MLALGIARLKNFGYHFIYSFTASMPRGLYLVIPAKNFRHHDIVEFTPPSTALNFLEQRQLPSNISLIKYVFAKKGDFVCTHHDTLLINGKKIASIYSTDDKNNPLPRFIICDRIRGDQYLLLSTKSSRSFDGRYFGLVSTQHIRGRAIPIFTE